MIYLSGAMSCFANTKNKLYPSAWRRCVENQLKDYSNKVKVFNPTKYYSYEEVKHYSQREIMNYELRKLKKSKVVLLDLFHFNDSDGTKCEVMSAYNWGIPVVAFGTIEDYDKLHPWFKEMIERVELQEDANSARWDIVDYIYRYYYE